MNRPTSSSTATRSDECCTSALNRASDCRSLASASRCSEMSRALTTRPSMAASPRRSTIRSSNQAVRPASPRRQTSAVRSRTSPAMTADRWCSSPSSLVRSASSLKFVSDQIRWREPEGSDDRRADVVDSTRVVDHRDDVSGILDEGFVPSAPPVARPSSGLAGQSDLSSEGHEALSVMPDRRRTRLDDQDGDGIVQHLHERDEPTAVREGDDPPTTEVAVATC